MTKLGPFFQKYGITSYCLHDYQEGSIRTVAYYWQTGSKTSGPPGYYVPPTNILQQVYQQVFLPLGLRVFNWGHGTAADSIISTLASMTPPASFVFEILYPAGYGPQDSNLAQQYPALQEYHLLQNTTTLQYSLLAAGGIPTDNIQQITNKWNNIIDQFVANNPQGVIGVHDADLSDNAGNYGAYPYGPPSGYKYLSSGHAVPSYANFIKTSDYLVSVNSSGNHLSDNTPCLIWQLSPSATLTPQLALDVYTYHFPHANYGGNANNYASGNYGHYLALGFATEEVLARNHMASKLGGALFHNFMQKTQLGFELSSYNFPDNLSYTFGATVNGPNQTPDPDAWFGEILPYGGAGSIPAFEDTWAATAPTGDTYVYQYFLTILPLAGNLPVSGWLENVGGLYLGGKYVPEMIEQVGISTPWGQAQGAGVWPHFGTELGKIPYLGGWYGWENDTFTLLAIAHHVDSTYLYQPLYNIAHAWGAHESEVNLQSLTPSNYKVVFIDFRDWIDPGAKFWQAIQNYVQQGGVLVVNNDTAYGATGSWCGMNSYLMQLAGITSATSATKGTLVVNQPNHPILQPYGANILSGYTVGWSCGTAKLTPTSTVTPIISDTNLGPVLWENKYGNGKVIMIEGPGTQSGFNYKGQQAGYYWLVMNAIAYAGGLKTPAIYFPSFSSTTNGIPSGEYFSIYGTPGNILVWLSNYNTSAINAGFKISAQFFGLTSWTATNVLTGATFTGQGDIDLTQLQLPPQEWTPLVISSPTPTQGKIGYTIVGVLAAISVGGLILALLKRKKRLLLSSMKQRLPQVYQKLEPVLELVQRLLMSRHKPLKGRVKNQRRYSYLLESLSLSRHYR